MACTRLEARGDGKDVRLAAVAPEEPLPTVEQLLDEIERGIAEHIDAGPNP